MGKTQSRLKSFSTGSTLKADRRSEASGLDSSRQSQYEEPRMQKGSGIERAAEHAGHAANDDEVKSERVKSESLVVTPPSAPSSFHVSGSKASTEMAANSAAGAAQSKYPPPPRHPLSEKFASQAPPTPPRPMPSAQTVPCQYRTGKTLGSGTYAVVKEAVHIKTGKYYACKVINKKLMEGREHMVRNEIAVLKKVSQGHRNIVTLHDYFETAHNLYLVFDLCTGGELFDRICAKGNYYEADAADLVRIILKAVQYIHGCGIVHRDLKPENLLFRSPAEDADIMIADFGLSRVMDDEKFKLLTEICGTPGYMAPEIFRKSGHGKPVDIWAMGVITYFLLCGYTPFDRDTQQEEMEAILAGDYRFEPREYWANVSEVARDFVRTLLTSDPTKRPTAQQALEHPWLASSSPHFVADPASPTGGPKDLLPGIKEGFNARKTFRKAVLSMMAMKRLSSHAMSPVRSAFAINVDEYKRAAEDEQIDENLAVLYGHPSDSSHSRTPSGVPSPTTPRTPLSPPNEHAPAVPPKDNGSLLSATDKLKLSDE